MLTPDQIRLRLEHACEAWDSGDGQWVADLFDLLGEVLPDLVAPTTRPQRSESQEDDGWGVWERGTNIFHSLPKPEPRKSRSCPDCTPEQPCARARELIGE